MSNQKNIAVPPVAKPYLFDILRKQNLKNGSKTHTSLHIVKPYFFDILLKQGRKKP